MLNSRGERGQPRDGTLGPMTVDRAAIERSWKERGFSCGLWVDPPGQVWSDYVHDTNELVMVVEGDVGFEIVGRGESLYGHRR